ELEVARDPRSHDARQGVEARSGGRVYTAVRNRGADLELHAIGSGARRQNVACWSCAVSLLQTVLQANRAVGAYQRLDLIEVNDDVVAFRHANSEAGDLHGSGQQVAVVGD